MSNFLLSYQESDQQPKKKNEKKVCTTPGAESMASAYNGKDTLYLNLPTTNGSPPLSHLLLKEPSCSEDKQEEHIENV